MWYVRDVLYAVLYVRVSCFVVCGCGVSRRYVDVSSSSSSLSALHISVLIIIFLVT